MENGERLVWIHTLLSESWMTFLHSLFSVLDSQFH